MPVRVYRSTDPEAPVLSGTVGSLINVLRACLVDGYGTQAPAGWSMPYTDGLTPPQRAHFRQAPRAGWEAYDIEILDDGNAGFEANRADYAAFWGWSGATGLGQGTLAFPVRTSNGVFVRKSATADATPRDWLVVASERAFHFVLYHATGSDWAAAYLGFFGDLLTVGQNDNTAVIAAGSMDPSYHGGLVVQWAGGVVLSAPATFQGAPGPVQLSMVYPPGTIDTVVGNGPFVYPNGPDGAGYIDRVMLTESGHLRGFLPGFWVPLHNWKSASNVTNGTILSGSGPLAGREFIVVKWGDGRTGAGTVAFALEMSDTWYTF